METQKEGVITIKDKGELIAMIYHNGGNKPVVYKVEAMGDEEIADLLKPQANL